MSKNTAEIIATLTRKNTEYNRFLFDLLILLDFEKDVVLPKTNIPYASVIVKKINELKEQVKD